MKHTIREVLGSLSLTDREQFILEQRFGRHTARSLGEVGRDLGIGRERVRQVQVSALKKVTRAFRAMRPLLDEAELSEGRRTADVAKSIQRAAKGRDAACSDDEAEAIVTLLRALNTQDLGSVRTLFPIITLAAATSGIPLPRDPRVREWLLDQAEQRQPPRDVPYRELALRILRAHDEPLHWRRIAEKAEQLRLRGAVNRSPLYNALQSGDDLFARVDAGTYALRERGYTDVADYPDIIAGALESTRTPMALGQIESAVNAVRAIKPKSLEMFLAMHPRFYQSVNGRFGLRSWLPPRSSQTLRTPADYVEDVDSFKRATRKA